VRVGGRSRTPGSRVRAPASMDASLNIGIEIVERTDVVVVAVEGDVDLCAATLFKNSLAIAAATDAPSIVLDLDRVSFMDAAGIHVLLEFSVSPPVPDSRLGAGAAAARRHRRPALPVVRGLARAGRHRPSAGRAAAADRLDDGAPQRASRAAFKVALGRIAEVTLSMSGR